MPSQTDARTDLTSALRRRLFGLGYRMLGTRADAQDIVQEIELRLHQHRGSVENVERFAFSIATRLCIDRLRHERVRRAAYVGPWLPEPLPSPDPSELTELSSDLAMGFMLLLERMTPAERVVYVLREAFDLTFEEIGDVLGVTAPVCRQRMRRAKARIAGRVVAPCPEDVARPLLEQLVAALQSGDTQRLVGLLCEDAVLLTDGGGRVPAAIVPVEGRSRIAAVLAHLVQRLRSEGSLDYRWIRLNGERGALMYLDGALYGAAMVAVEGGRIRQIMVVRNPDKLGAVAEFDATLARP
ncbi:MAG: sigma-70 family RNA polymerase sigma factor [Gammaproteobacteria bacterium]|nr:sigma-70 family RNA polymerase sigma factor [Gammaproteobacteria bacterium]